MNEQQLDQNNEISLVDLYKILKNNLIMIIILTLLVGTIAALYAFLIVTPKYQSRADVLVQVSVDTSSPDNNALLYMQRILSTASDYLKSELVLEDVKEMLDLDIPVSVLRNNLSVSFSTTSFYIYVSYQDEDPLLARDIVNQVIASAKEIANTDTEIVMFRNVIIQTSQAKPGTYVSPNKTLYTIIGLLLGGIIGVGIAFTKELFNTTFRDKDQLEAILGIQVLGVIPEFEVKEDKK
jgi:capsular polysaccharide biosynthesis protein